MVRDLLQSRHPTTFHPTSLNRLSNAREDLAFAGGNILASHTKLMLSMGLVALDYIIVLVTADEF
jgi:hypothetical protein